MTFNLSNIAPFTEPECRSVENGVRPESLPDQWLRDRKMEDASPVSNIELHAPLARQLKVLSRVTVFVQQWRRPTAFNKTFTQAGPQRADAVSGNESASFLLSCPAAGSVDRNIDTAYRNQYLALFRQDDFKLSANLILNMVCVGITRRRGDNDVTGW